MTGKKFGYVRVSTIDQNPDRQLEGIQLDKVFTDKASGKSIDRPQLEAMLEFVREGDVVFVHSMDRLARNLVDLRRIVSRCTEKGVQIEFLKEGLKFTGDDSPMSILLLSMMGAFAEFERSLIRERQKEGIVLAKAKGVYKGRKPTLTNEKFHEAIKQLEMGIPKAKVARNFGISRETLYQYLKGATV